MAGAVLLGFGVPAIDRAFGLEFVSDLLFGGTPGAARTVVSAVATSLVPDERSCGLSRRPCAVLFVSAHAETETLARIRKVDAHGFVVKPFARPQLEAAVVDVVAPPPAPGSRQAARAPPRRCARFRVCPSGKPRNRPVSQPARRGDTTRGLHPRHDAEYTAAEIRPGAA